MQSVQSILIAILKAVPGSHSLQLSSSVVRQPSRRKCHPAVKYGPRPMTPARPGLFFSAWPILQVPSFRPRQVSCLIFRLDRHIRLSRIGHRQPPNPQNLDPRRSCAARSSAALMAQLPRLSLNCLNKASCSAGVSLFRNDGDKLCKNCCIEVDVALSAALDVTNPVCGRAA